MKKEWLRQFAIDHKMDKATVEVKIEHEKRDLHVEPGMISGWELTGVTYYSIRDKLSEYHVRVQKVGAWTSQ